MMAEMRALAALAVCVTCLVTSVNAQGPDAFDAVAITRAEEGVPPLPTLNINPGYLRARAASLRYLITQAFGIENYQVSGTTRWMESETYAIEAAAGQAVDRPQMMTMLRDMLVTRFQLKVHHETRQVPVFALVVDKGGSKLVPLMSLKEWNPAFESRCGNERLLPIGTSIQDLVRHLNSRTGSAALGRPVIDRTGIEGLYKIKLTYEYEANPDGVGGRYNIDYFAAVKSELGLRLDPRKEAIDTLVIDGAERPKLDQ